MFNLLNSCIGWDNLVLRYYIFFFPLELMRSIYNYIKLAKPITTGRILYFFELNEERIAQWS